MKLLPRESPSLRCAFCHDAIRVGTSCPCGALSRKQCLRENRLRCPSCGRVAEKPLGLFREVSVLLVDDLAEKTAELRAREDAAHNRVMEIVRGPLASAKTYVACAIWLLIVLSWIAYQAGYQGALWLWREILGG